MKLTTLPALFVDELKDLFSAETQLVRALPKMAKAATAPKLRQTLTDHLHESQVHLNRLEKIIERMGVGPKGRECKAMETWISEAKDLTDDEAHPSVMDAALIAAAQRMEHYELAGYGCVCTFARKLGYDQAADLLQSSLDEKVEREKRLTELANSVISGGVVAAKPQK